MNNLNTKERVIDRRRIIGNERIIESSIKYEKQSFSFIFLTSILRIQYFSNYICDCIFFLIFFTKIFYKNGVLVINLNVCYIIFFNKNKCRNIN